MEQLPSVVITRHCTTRDNICGVLRSRNPAPLLGRRIWLRKMNAIETISNINRMLGLLIVNPMINCSGISEEDLATYLNVDVFSDLKCKFHSSDSSLQLETRDILANINVGLLGWRYARLGCDPRNSPVFVEEESDATITNQRSVCEDEKNDLLLAVC